MLGRGPFFTSAEYAFFSSVMITFLNRSTMNHIAAVIQVARVAGVNPAGLPDLWWPLDVLISA
jgi:hypothetical protein